MSWIDTPASQPIVFPEKVNRNNFDDIVWDYHRYIRRFFYDTFSKNFDKKVAGPSIVFYDYEIDREIQWQKNIYIYYDREKNEICISRDMLGNIWFIKKNNITALGLYLLIGHEFGHAFEELGDLTMTQIEQEGFADIYSGYAFRHAYQDNNMHLETMRWALLIFEELWVLCREMEEKYGTKNIHGDEKVRIKNFLTGYMMTPQQFSESVAQFAQTKKGIKLFKNLLLSFLK